MREKQSLKIYKRTFPMGLRKGDQKRLEILEAAISVLSKEGLDGLSFDRISQRIGTRRSHLIYYFATKTDLLENMFKFITATAQEITVDAVTAARNPYEKLRAAGLAAFDWTERHPDQARVMTLLYFAICSDRGLRKIHTEVRAAGLERLGAIVSLHLGREDMEVARSLQGLLTGLLIEKMTTESSAVDYRQIWSRQLDLSIPQT